MTESAREIAILSLGQILAIGDEEIQSDRVREMLERHVRQVAAIVQDKPLNRPDDSTGWLLSQVRELLKLSQERVDVSGVHPAA